MLAAEMGQCSTPSFGELAAAGVWTTATWQQIPRALTTFPTGVGNTGTELLVPPLAACYACTLQGSHQNEIPLKSKRRARSESRANASRPAATGLSNNAFRRRLGRIACVATLADETLTVLTKRSLFTSIFESLGTRLSTPWSQWCDVLQTCGMMSNGLAIAARTFMAIL